MIPRPAAGEFADFYAPYIAAVPEGDLLAYLDRQAAAATALLATLAPEQAGYRYAPGKWSVREVVGHLSDAERIFSYRMLRIARCDMTPLAGFDEDAFVAASGADARPIASLARELAAVRASTIALLESLDEPVLARVGVANGHPVSVHALAWITAGHARHHLRVLGERYGLATGAALD